MRKVSFFNKKNSLLLCLLVWEMLLDRAAGMQISQWKELQAARMVQKEEAGKERAENVRAETAVSESIRVLLMTTGYQSYEHTEVSGICRGTPFSYTASDPEMAEGSLTLDGGADGIRITSIERQCGQPLYYGTLELLRNGDTLHLINQVPLETYLESVVPSEMPASYHEEALKAQAVCARTYAWKHMEGDGLKGYEADVDDSVSYQVYGNIQPQESTNAAVCETKGMILCQNGEPVDTYYFSTSSGVTSTDEVWGAENGAAHLKSVECVFDRDAPWRRWEVSIPWENLEKNPKCKEGLLSVEVTKKSQSNAVTGLTVLTENGSFEVETEYAVREFLSPKDCVITEKDGTETMGGSLLPSAYFTMEAFPGERLMLTGGGYGHGVGMSQNGADGMAGEGYSFAEILDYFFRDTELECYGSLPLFSLAENDGYL